MSTPSRDTESSEINNPPTIEINQHSLLTSLSSTASDVAGPVAPPKKRRVQWVGLSEDEPEQRASVQSNLDPFDSPHDADSPTPTPTPLTANAASPFFAPAAPTTGILSRRLPTTKLSLSMPETILRSNPYFPPITPDTNQASRGDPPSSANPDRGFRSRADQMVTPDSSRPPTPDSDLDIPFGERDGLPSDPNRRARTFTREAANLVSLHKFKLGASTRREPASQSATTPTTNVHAIPRNGIPVGKGVLSSLLGLYNHPPSAQSSSATLFSYGSEDDLEAGNGRPNSRSFDKSTRRISRGWAKVTGGLGNDRPVAARSGAGVVGALQAGAMGLAGVATPAASNIAPVVHKPGFRVGRYSPAGDEVPPVSVTPSSENLYEMKDVEQRAPHAGASQDDLIGLRRIGSEGLDLGSAGDTTRGPTSGLASSASSLFGASMGARSMSKSGSLVNLRALGEVLNPQTYHNESAVLRAKRVAPGMNSGSTPGSPREELCEKEKDRPARHNVARRRLEKRRQEEIFITMHVAAILQRQQFILQLTRAMMMFGGPSHRLESQVQATARVLEIDLQMVMIHSLCIFSFQDEATHTSETKFIKQSPNVDLGKLTDLTTLHWEVVHDKIGVQEASTEISRLMRARPEYGTLSTIAIGALCSAFIGPAAFHSSVLDILIAAPLGAGLVAAQLLIASKSDVLSQIFEIVVTSLASFIAAAVASTGIFCYSAIIASSIVLILPGWLVCCAALELQSRSIVSGSVRLIWAVIYALFLGLGISIGAQFWTLFSGHEVKLSVDGMCNSAHSEFWYLRTIPLWSAFITVPGFALFLALRQQARLASKELWVMVLLASGGWAANHFASIAFPNRSDISSAIGSFVVGIAANVYGRLFQGTAFIVALVPILFQLPSGLGNGGLLYFANTQDSTQSFTNGSMVGQQLIEVSLGLVIGLFAATVIVYPFGNRRGGLMTF